MKTDMRKFRFWFISQLITRLHSKLIFKTGGRTISRSEANLHYLYYKKRCNGPKELQDVLENLVNRKEKK